ncbi:hypothetical protein BB561_006933, partial [Smittium simulii]
MYFEFLGARDLRVKAENGRELVKQGLEDGSLNTKIGRLGDGLTFVGGPLPFWSLELVGSNADS